MGFVWHSYLWQLACRHAFSYLLFLSGKKLDNYMELIRGGGFLLKSCPSVTSSRLINHRSRKWNIQDHLKHLIIGNNIRRKKTTFAMLKVQFSDSFYFIFCILVILASVFNSACTQVEKETFKDRGGPCSFQIAAANCERNLPGKHLRTRNKLSIVGPNFNPFLRKLDYCCLINCQLFNNHQTHRGAQRRMSLPRPSLLCDPKIKQ